MKDTIKKQFQIMAEDWILGGGMILGGFLLGQILLAVLLNTDQTETYIIPLGSIMAAAAAGIFLIVESVTSIRIMFHLEVSMGCTRKRFSVSFFTVQLMSCAAALFVLLFLAWGVWMILCIGFPQIHDAMEEAPGSFFGVLGMRIIEMIGKVPAGAWIGVLSAVVIGCVAGAWQIIRSQEVLS